MRRMMIVVGLALALIAAPAATAEPVGLTAGPDGSVWFTQRDSLDVHGKRIGSITPDGRVREHWRGIRSSRWEDWLLSGAITLGPDGNLWFTEDDAIGRITPNGRVRYFSRGIPRDASPSSITAGPDGNLWFTDEGGWHRGGRIARMTPSGRITWFPTGARFPGPTAITAGPDGNLWFTAPGDGPDRYPIPWWDDPPPTGRIGRITPSGEISSFSRGLSPPGSTRPGWPTSITAGPDGNLWFTQPYRDGVGRITPSGIITEFRAGIRRCSRPAAITAGADGNLWFTEPGESYPDPESPCRRPMKRIGRITPDGAVTDFPVGAPPQDIVAGPDGNVWFIGGNRIGRITPDGVVTEFPEPVRVGGARRVGRRGVFLQVRCRSCRGTVRLLSPDGAGGRAGDVVGSRRFAARAGHPARLVVPLSRFGRRLLAARGRLPNLRARVQAEPTRLIGAQDTRGFVFRDPAAIRGKAVRLRVTAAIRHELRTTHTAGRSPGDRARTRGPLSGSTYRARLGRGEWAIASFWNPRTGGTDGIAVFNRPVGGRWHEIGDTWDPCESEIPGSVLAAWGLDRCEWRPSVAG